MSRSWAPESIERAAGIPAADTGLALTLRRDITAELAGRVPSACDFLWDKQPPRATREDQELAGAARAHARRHGWPPPMAYDDDLIDLPGGDAGPGWKRSSRTTVRSADLAEDAQFIREHGGCRLAPSALVAMRLGVTKGALERRRPGPGVRTSKPKPAKGRMK